MSRNAAATELQDLIERLNSLAAQAERLATASGGLVNPSHFRGMQAMATMAMGDLDSKGLAVRRVAEPG